MGINWLNLVLMSSFWGGVAWLIWGPNVALWVAVVTAGLNLALQLFVAPTGGATGSY